MGNSSVPVLARDYSGPELCERLIKLLCTSELQPFKSNAFGVRNEKGKIQRSPSYNGEPKTQAIVQWRQDSSFELLSKMRDQFTLLGARNYC